MQTRGLQVIFKGREVFFCQVCVWAQAGGPRSARSRQEEIHGVFVAVEGEAEGQEDIRALREAVPRDYEEADNMRGVTGTNMLVLLEMRLDNVVYRMGIGVSRSHARQLVCHGHITVNGKRVDIPSYRVKVGDVVAIKENKRDNAFFKDFKEMKKSGSMPKWLDFDPEAYEGKVIAKPEREDIDLNIEERMIIELYSK